MLIHDVSVVSCDGKRVVADVTYSVRGVQATTRVAATRSGLGVKLETSKSRPPPAFVVIDEELCNDLREELAYSRDILREKN